MKCKVVYLPSLKADIRDEVEYLVNKYAFMLPTWLHTLSVMGWQNETHLKEIPYYTAEMSVTPEYRKATLMIYPKWREMDEDYHDSTIAHEFGHAIMGSVDAFVDNLIDNMENTDDVKAFLHEEYRKVTEGAVEDMAQAVHHRLEVERKAAKRRR